MRISPVEIAGAFLIEERRSVDSRGHFARTFCARELAAAGLDARVDQVNVSHNVLRGTLRGMHYQRAPHHETKIVRAIRGAIHDVILDLRRGSSTFGRWAAFTLEERDGRALYVPPGVAHGFLTLADDTDVLYLMGGAFVPEAQAGVRHDDPAFGIAWPGPVAAISDRDLGFAPWPPAGDHPRTRR